MRRVPWVVFLASLSGASSAATAWAEAPGAASTAVAQPAVGAGPATPQPPLIPDWRFVVNNLLIFRYNPLGLEDQIRAGLQKRLAHSDRLLFRDTFLFFGLAPKINPAFLKLGPSLEIQPLSVLNVRVAAELVDYFSTFGYLQSFNSPLADYSDAALSANDKLNNASYATAGVHFLIEPTLQAKVGPFALRDKFAVEYWHVNLRGANTVFYEATLDTAVPGNGWVLTNDLDALYVTRFGLTVGARYSLVKPLYKRSDYQPGEDSGLNPNGHHRLGVIAAYTFFDRGYVRFNKPTLLVIAAWYLQHRYRAGSHSDAEAIARDEQQSQGVPYLVVGFAFQSDVMK
jgi:hypothetical protein